MSEYNFGLNLVTLLNSLASLDDHEIDSNQFEVEVVKESGEEGFATVEIQSLAKDAADAIAELQQKLDAMLAKGMELAQEAAHVYAEYNKEMAPDVVCDGQTIQEFYDLANGWSSVESYLNSVRAEGADAVAFYHKERFDFLANTCREVSNKHKEAYLAALDVAAQLRSGNHDTADKAG